MPTKLPFLPGLVLLTGDLEHDIGTLYDIFRRDFIETTALYNGIVVSIDVGKLDGKERSFWHLTHYGYSKWSPGTFDWDRSARLQWARSLIDARAQDSLLVWDFRESNFEIRRYLWAVDDKYVVILQKVGIAPSEQTYRVITAFFVDFNRKEDNLKEKYRNRL